MSPTRRPTVGVTARSLTAAAADALMRARGARPADTITPVVRSELGAHELVNAVNGNLTDRGLAVRLHLLAEGLDGDRDAWAEAAAVLGVVETEHMDMGAAGEALAKIVGGDKPELIQGNASDAALLAAGLVRRIRRDLAAAGSAHRWELDLTPLGRKRLRDLSLQDIAGECLRRCGGLTAEGR